MKSSFIYQRVQLTNEHKPAGFCVSKTAARMDAVSILAKNYVVLSMAGMLDMIKELFKEEGWKTVPSIRKGKLIVHFVGENGEFDCQATVEEEDGLFVFHSILEPEGINDDNRKKIMEFINMANFGMYLGNMEMDPDGNQIRFKTGIDVMNDRLTPALVSNVVYGNVVIMDNHLPCFQKIIEEGATAEEAMELMEEDF